MARPGSVRRDSKSPVVTPYNIICLQRDIKYPAHVYRYKQISHPIQNSPESQKHKKHKSRFRRILSERLSMFPIDYSLCPFGGAGHGPGPADREQSVANREYINTNKIY